MRRVENRHLRAGFLDRTLHRANDIWVVIARLGVDQHLLSRVYFHVAH
jgi:hypothetical protein